MDAFRYSLYISVGFGLLVFICCLLSSKKRADYEDYRREKWNKYVSFQDPELRKSLEHDIIVSTDEEFEAFLVSLRSSVKYRRDKNGLRIRKNICMFINNIWMNSYSEKGRKIYKRLKKLEEIVPLLKRVYFGPKYTPIIYRERKYEKSYQRRKFNFPLQPDSTAPKLDTIIDVAYHLQTSIRLILAIIYTQSHSRDRNYVKITQIDKALHQKGNSYLRVVGSPIARHVDIDQSFILKDKRGKVPKNAKTTDPQDAYLEYKELDSNFYTRKTLVKPNGRKRLIAVPNEKLRSFQRIILKTILEKAALPDVCTGFTKTRSTVTNAEFHVGAQTLVKVDLHNFFNNLSLDHVFEVFRGFGYNRPVSGILANLCTDYYRSRRYLPQGASTSPMIANLYALHLDRRLEGLANKYDLIYSRYADDLTFSSKDPKIRVRTFIQAVYKIIKSEKLYPNYQKTKVYRKQHKKSVTGITVNEKVNIDRKWVNAFRGELYRYSKFGVPEEDRFRIVHQMHGKFAFLKMVNPEVAKKYETQISKFIAENS